MKLVLTLVVRTEADVADAQIAYHLNAGVDFVIAAADQESRTTTEMLEAYERNGHLRMLRGDEAEGPDLRTRMARLATEHGADWVINAEPAEFWWPRGESLKDVLAPIPPRYTIVQGLRRPFVETAGGNEPFSERMTQRRSVEDSGGRPSELLRGVHRADPNVVVHEDGTVVLGRQVPLRAWYPIEVMQFEAVAEQVPIDSPVTDTRLRDALRALREQPSAGHAFALPRDGTSALTFRTPDVVDDAAYAVECAAVGEVDLLRLEAYVTELEQRVGWLELRLWPRLLKSASRRLKRQS